MSTSRDDDGPPRGDRGECSECGAAHGGGQRYCLRCGARLGSLPAAIAGQLPEMLRRKRGGGEEAPPEESGTPIEEAPKPKATSAYTLPPPRVAAAAVLAMLGLGVLLGSVTSHLAQSAGLTSILLEAEPGAVAEAPVEEEEPEFAEAEPEPVEEPEAVPSSVPELPPPPEEEPGLPPEPEAPPELPEEEGLPDVKHVFVVALGENGFEETFGPTSQAPYLKQTLPEQGELLTNYFAVAPSVLANQIALLSGQGPTVETAAGCPTYADVVPATVSGEGQVEGNGCVYPAATPTLPAQLTKEKLKWKAYVEGAEGAAASAPAAPCQPSERDPFVYFHAVVDDPGKCAQTDVALGQLATDLKKAATTPTFSYVVPNACHAGGPEPCEPARPSGPLAAEEFLKALVPLITASPAYEEGGLIAITSSQAPQTGASPDTSSCCVNPTYPNVPPAPEAAPVTGPVKPTGGGGRVGLLLLSPFVKPGTVNETTYANHYSLLLSIEELFELERIGYAAEPALVGFDASVYNVAEEAEGEALPKQRRLRRGSALAAAGLRPR